MSNEKNTCKCPFCNQEVEPSGGMTAEERLVRDILTLAREMQDRGKLMNCPRCGRTNMAERNAVSRSFPVEVCPDCGTEEALLAKEGNELPFDKWWFVKRIKINR